MKVKNFETLNRVQGERIGFIEIPYDHPENVYYFVYIAVNYL